ncbi:LysM peptidoglycan-binding domain-containing protein [Cytobacillus horneckiae]|uniref:LysM peptidoglycan-binding domain-containing protein n=1 Tax=Cytobacillus horneckiae TaxID=549687 RepID=A0A2N0ZCW1_9BACI|nr:LysM peptidoglycan-binding domain-containing protein [Cytobacillus horneckiae]MEC1156572.1 LysM peptidoglycan-binding domain-containing protein [Cytobacillus horneckiae]MED2938903.1 LysM peptidoglycan-binding domain-containing protein [Cytobacillus horneckiae]PKG27350.1 LysM peptidoglycan-binding domain-containing protein [Cytobacillus horneckiae]
MNKEAPFREKAVSHRQRIHKKQDSKEQQADFNEPEKVVAGRSRTSIQREKRQKNKRKSEYPVIRLLAAFFITLPIVTLSVYYFFLPGASSNSETASDFETVGFSGNNGTTEANAVVDDEDNEEEKKAKEQAEKEKAQKEQEQKEKEQKEKELKEKEQKEKEQKAKEEAKKLEEEKKKQAAAEKEQREKEEREKQKQQEQQQQESKEKVIYHTVKQEETMYRIAMTYYQSQNGIEKIKRANNLQSNEIHVGQVLTIPLD